MSSKNKKDSKFYFVDKDEGEALLSAIDDSHDTEEDQNTVLDKVSSKNIDEVSIEDVSEDSSLDDSTLEKEEVKDDIDSSIKEESEDVDSLVDNDGEDVSSEEIVEEVVDDSAPDALDNEILEDESSKNDDMVDLLDSSSEVEKLEDELLVEENEKLEDTIDSSTLKENLKELTNEEENISEKSVPDNHNQDDSMNKESLQKSVDDHDINSTQLNKKLYFSFETRIIIMLSVVLLLVLFSILFVFKTIKFDSTETLNYNEKSTVSYSVCLKNASNSGQSCLDEGLQYDPSLVQKITTKFQYEALFTDSVNYHVDYHVVGLIKIFDSTDNTKVLYKNEELLLEKNTLTDNSDTIELNADVNLDYVKYQKTVQDYIAHNNVIGANATLEVILFLDEPDEARKISSVTIPVNAQPFQVGKFNISNYNQSIEIASNRWNQYTISYAVVATVFFVIALILIYRVTRLVIKVANNRSEYQEKLSQILREYDRIIVVARDGYESNVSKQVVKLNSFDDLLDARDALEKPIIYSKVNSIKSEFIVEDEDKLYKYVLKEADL